MALGASAMALKSEIRCQKSAGLEVIKVPFPFFRIEARKPFHNRLKYHKLRDFKLVPFELFF